jgi:hypothetical protein
MEDGELSTNVLHTRLVASCMQNRNSKTVSKRTWSLLTKNVHTAHAALSFMHASSHIGIGMHTISHISFIHTWAEYSDGVQAHLEPSCATRFVGLSRPSTAVCARLGSAAKASDRVCGENLRFSRSPLLVRCEGEYNRSVGQGRQSSLGTGTAGVHGSEWRRRSWGQGFVGFVKDMSESVQNGLGLCVVNSLNGYVVNSRLVALNSCMVVSDLCPCVSGTTASSS